MKPLKGRSIMGRCWYDCGCGHRFRSTVVVGSDTVRCPTCKQRVGLANVSPLRERGGVRTPRWMTERDNKARAAVEAAARLLLPGDVGIRVVGLGPDVLTCSSGPLDHVQADPVQIAQIDPSPRQTGASDAATVPQIDPERTRKEAADVWWRNGVERLKEAHAGSIEDMKEPMAALAREYIARFGSPVVDEAALSKLLDFAPLAEEQADHRAGNHDGQQPVPLREVSPDVQRILEGASRLTLSEAAVLDAARNIARCYKDGHHWPLSESLRRLSLAVTAMDAAEHGLADATPPR